MLSFIVSTAIFFVAVAILFLSQMKPLRKRKSNLHEIKTSTTNIIQLRANYTPRRSGSRIAEKVDDAVKWR